MSDEASKFAAVVWMPPELGRKICETVIDALLEREALLSGIPPQIVSQIPISNTPAGRHLIDFNFLLSLGELDDGTVPILLWLRSASILLRGRREHGIIEEGIQFIENKFGSGNRTSVQKKDIMLPFGSNRALLHPSPSNVERAIQLGQHDREIVRGHSEWGKISIGDTFSSGYRSFGMGVLGASDIAGGIDRANKALRRMAHPGILWGIPAPTPIG